ncbi:MAG: sigma-70 family RNA polymerase sigma factor [Pseudomonadota bacterium]
MSTGRNRLAIELFDQHRSELELYAARIVGCPSRAEDIVQDAFFRLINGGATQFDKPVAYVFRVVRNLAIDVLRREQREARIFRPDAETGDIERVQDTAKSPDAKLVDRDELQVITQAIAGLPERTRHALTMHVDEELGLREIAGRLGVSVGTAHALVRDGTLTCRDALKRSRS